MKRREFLKQVGKGILGVAGLSLKGCSKKLETDYHRVLRQEGIGDGKIKLGIMSDLHAHKENSKYFADKLNQEGVEAFLLLGDLSLSFGDYEGAKDDYNEIIEVVEPVASTGKMVLAIPGNHEQRKTYSKALEYLASKYENVIDMQKVPVAVLDDLTIIAVGGNDNPRFNVPKGYLLTQEDFVSFLALIKQYQSDKPLLIATHIPQKYKTERGLDFSTRNNENVGSVYLANVRQIINSKFAVSGHIHEAFGIVNPVTEEIIPQGKLSDKLDFNPGAVYDYVASRNLKPSAGILEFVGNKARAYILNK